MDIQEKAKDFVVKRTHGNSYEDSCDYMGKEYCEAMRKSYIKVATEIQQETLEEAFKWFSENGRGWLNKDDMKKEFLKAMNE